MCCCYTNFVILPQNLIKLQLEAYFYMFRVELKALEKISKFIFCLAWKSIGTYEFTTVVTSATFALHFNMKVYTFLNI